MPFIDKHSENRQRCIEECALLGYYAASSGNFLPTFRDNLWAPISGVKNPRERITILPLKMGPIGSPETSLRNCQYSQRINREERISHLLRGGSLKSHTVFFYSISR